MKGYKFCLHKAYFDKGYGLLNQVKYALFLFGVLEGIQTEQMWITAAAGISFIIICYFAGRWWYRSKMIEAEIEVTNRFDLFVKEVRKRKHI